MRRRTQYVLLFAIPALLLAAIAAVSAAAAAAGVFWIFVFGDNTWPAWSGAAVVSVALLVGSVSLAAMLVMAWSVGQREEMRPSFNRLHVGLAVGTTIVLVGLIGLRLAGTRDVPQSDAERCAALCRDSGFAASGMPPRDSGDRTCTCYDAKGGEARRVELPER